MKSDKREEQQGKKKTEQEENTYIGRRTKTQIQSMSYKQQKEMRT